MNYRKTWNEIKQMKHEYREGFDRDYLSEKYPDLERFIELEDFVIRFNSMRSSTKLFDFENRLARRVAKILSE